MILNKKEYFRHLRKSLHVPEEFSLYSWDQLAFWWVNFESRLSCCDVLYFSLTRKTIYFAYWREPFSSYNEIVIWIVITDKYSWLSPCGHLAIMDTPLMLTRASPPGETHKEMTDTNSRYYRLLLLRKCGHFPTPKRYSRHLSTSSKILTHIT